MGPSRNIVHIISRLACSRNFIITLVLAVGLSPIYLFPEYFIPLTDSTEQLYPFVLETKRMLSTGSPWWTWQSFLGDNFIGAYAYYTFTRPLLLAVCLLPYRYVGAGIVASVYLNFLILAWLTSCYLRVMGFGGRLRLIGCLLFTLSSFMICQLFYCMFFEPVQAFVILLICIERFLQGRRYSLTALTLASFAVAFVNYYFMPASIIAAAIYFLCRTLCCYRERWAGLTLKAAGCVCLGVLMAAVVIFPVMMYLSGSSRAGAAGANLNIAYGNNWGLRMLSLIAPTPYEGKLRLLDVDSGYNMNMAYLGIFGLLPFLFYAARHRRSWITILCAVYIVFLVTPLNGLFNLFTHPYYTRWCYALIMAVLIATLSYLRERSGRLIPRRATLVYCAVSLVCLAAVYCYAVFVRLYLGAFELDDSWGTYIAASVLLLLNLGGLLLLTRRPVLSRPWIRTCISSIVVIAILHCLFLSYRYAQLPVGENNIYETMVRLTDSRSECDTFTSRTFYEPHPRRHDKNVNYHLISNRQSLPTYISTSNPATIRLSYLLNHSISWNIFIDRYHESAFTLLSVKDFDRFSRHPYSQVPEAALRGDRYIPMGMAYDRYSVMDDSLADIDHARRHDILRGMLASVLIDKADETELSRYMSPVEFRDSLPLDSLVAARRACTCDSFKGDSHGFTATISLPDTMVVMFSAAADPGFRATIDGKPTKIYNVNMGMSASVVPAGRHTVRYEYFPPGLRQGALVSLVALMVFLGLTAAEYRLSRRAAHSGSHS